MKKFLLAAAIIMVSSIAMAQYTGPSNAAVTVKEALSAKDDTLVTLTGKVEKRINSDKYLFTDNTGSITVEIDDELWYGLTLSDNELIKITGKIDKDLLSRKVDVKRIEKIQ